MGGKAGCGRARGRRIQQYAHVVAAFVGGEQVGLAVAIHIGRRQAVGVAAGGESSRGGKGGRGRACRRGVEQHAHGPAAVVYGEQVGFAVAVHVGCCHAVGAEAGSEISLGGEAGRSRARRRGVQQHAHGVGVAVGGEQIRLAVAVDIGHRHAFGGATGGKDGQSSEAGRGRARRRRVQQHAYRVAAEVGRYQVGFAVAIHVGRRHAAGAAADTKEDLSSKAGRGRARRGGVEQHAHVGTGAVGRNQVGLAVAVHVGRHHAAGAEVGGEGGLGGKAGRLGPGRAGRGQQQRAVTGAVK